MMQAVWTLMLLHFAKVVKSVECKSLCHNVIQYVILDDKTSLSCEITEPEGISRSRALPAPRPSHLKVAWEERIRHQISLSISWEQKREDIINEMITGHTITFFLDGLSKPYFVKLHVTKSRENANPKIVPSNEHQSGYIQFKFTCFGRDGWVLLRPLDTIDVEVKGVPLPGIRDTDQVIQTKLKIPGKKAIQARRLVTSAVRDLTTVLYSDGQGNFNVQSKNTTDTDAKVNGLPPQQAGAIILSVTTLILLALLVAVCLIARRNSTGKPNSTDDICVQDKRKTIISITNTQENLSEVHACMENLRMKLGVSIISNWSNRNNIHKIGLYKWFHDNLTDNQNKAIVIFIDLETRNNATISSDWELILARCTKPHQNQKLIYLHEASALMNGQVTKHPQIVKFEYKKNYDENDDLYRYLLRVCS